ncbi:fibronectin type 3 and ankyrin repeat domains protein 1-like [Pollicipes pollicipes]|uniref:fibronectin type 3 and ankyrin repeat domains protein 1-like n=1 Tax=Pollicipes pollicipes TaxID=41117 RepID=UPI0018859620|nr:fibronectin type 3 and ankyrin repeat domains protein 1-like [Pollicipes pollicipes]
MSTTDCVTSIGEDEAMAAGRLVIECQRVGPHELHISTLEVYEPGPAGRWVQLYRGFGHAHCLRRLQANAPYRLRVSRGGEASEVHSFMTSAAPVSATELHRAVQLDRPYGLTALMVAAREGFAQMAALLLRCGADVNVRSHGAAKTALMFASFAGHLAITEQLLSAGADVRAADSSGRSALHHAADGGSCAVLRRLVQAGSPLEQADSQGWTALMRAALLGGPVTTLMGLGARTDGVDSRGRQLRRMGTSPLRTADLMGVWRRGARILQSHPWRSGRSLPKQSW